MTQKRFRDKTKFCPFNKLKWKLNGGKKRTWRHLKETALSGAFCVILDEKRWDKQRGHCPLCSSSSLFLQPQFCIHTLYLCKSKYSWRRAGMHADTHAAHWAAVRQTEVVLLRFGRRTVKEAACWSVWSEVTWSSQSEFLSSWCHFFCYCHHSGRPCTRMLSPSTPWKDCGRPGQSQLGDMLVQESGPVAKIESLVARIQWLNGLRIIQWHTVILFTADMLEIQIFRLGPSAAS